MPNDQGLDLDQIIQQTSAGWRQVGDPVAETAMATDVTGAQKPTQTGRWLATITDGTHSRQLILRPVRVEGPTGKVSWSLEEGPKDVSASAGAQPSNVPAATDQRYLVTRNPDGSMSAQENPNYKGDKDDKSTLQPFGDQLLQVKPDGTVTVLATKPKDPEKPTTVAFGDTLYAYDGTTITPLATKPKEPDKPTTYTDSKTGTLYQWDPQTKAWAVAPGTTPGKPAVAVSTNTQAPNLVSIDDQGNVVGSQANPNYVPPTPTQLTPDLVAPTIPLLKPDGTIQWIPNQNRVPASQAMLDLLDQAHVKVNGGQLSMADAKDVLTGAVNTMNAQTAATNAATAQQTAATTAASTVLENQRQGAQTGAGLLNQRVQSGQGMLSSVLGLAGQRPMVGLPANAGQMIMSDIQGMTTQLGGGQGVYDTAARLVQAADPQGGRSPEAAQAYGVISQILDRYKQQTGQDHPTVTATQAANASQQQNGFVPPAPVQQPAPVAAGMQAPVGQVPAQNYGAATAYTGGVPPWQQGWTAPGANYSYPGPAPWAAPPGASFVAPPALTAAAVLGR